LAIVIYKGCTGYLILNRQVKDMFSRATYYLYYTRLSGKMLSRPGNMLDTVNTLEQVGDSQPGETFSKQAGHLNRFLGVSNRRDNGETGKSMVFSPGLDCFQFHCSGKVKDILSHFMFAFNYAFSVYCPVKIVFNPTIITSKGVIMHFTTDRAEVHIAFNFSERTRLRKQVSKASSAFSNDLPFSHSRHI
jgi:hypothetical protein